jgi:hypothetical protein
VRNRGDLTLTATPPLSLPSFPGFSTALAAKLQIVAAECFFEDPDADLAAKKVKTQTLTELIEVAGHASEMSRSDLDKFTAAIEKPIFRVIPDVPPVYLRSDDMVIITESSWPHYSIHYQIMTVLIQRIPTRYATVAFAQRLVTRLLSNDIAEREAVAGLFKSIHQTNPDLSETIARMMTNIVVDYMEKLVSPIAVPPALVVFYGIVHENTPSDENPRFVSEYLQKVLPLLSSQHYVSFQSQMRKVIQTFLYGAPRRCGMSTLKSILHYFPLTRCSKAIEFMELMSFALEVVSARELLPTVKAIALLLGRCAASCHTKLVEACYQVWNRVHFDSCVMDNAKAIYPLVYSTLAQAQGESWTPDITAAINRVFGLLARLDATTYQEMVRQKGVKPLPVHDARKCWAAIARQASKADSSINLSAKLPEIQRMFSVMGPKIKVGDGLRSGSMPVTAQSQGVREAFLRLTPANAQIRTPF